MSDFVATFSEAVLLYCAVIVALRWLRVRELERLTPHQVAFLVMLVGLVSQLVAWCGRPAPSLIAAVLGVICGYAMFT